MRATDRVRLKGPGTDLRFSIKGIGVVPCEGRRNLPDGECFTAPVRDSANGTIRFNTPSLYLGTTYENLSFTLEAGRIVRASGQPEDRLERLLESDEGARYSGEVWFDDELVRKDGRFLPPDLEGLNPEALLGEALAGAR